MIAFNYMKKLNGEDPGQTPDPEPDPTPTEKCPNKPECNVETCECGETYCSTHDFHVCTIGGKRRSRPYLHVTIEPVSHLEKNYITHSKLQRYNFTDERWEGVNTDPEFDSTSYDDYANEIKAGMYTYKKISKVDMSITVKEEDLGEYVCDYDEVPPRS